MGGFFGRMPIGQENTWTKSHSRGIVQAAGLLRQFPTRRKVRRIFIMMQEWFKKAKLGIFIHWGIYAVGED